jgi:UrcA family protein
MKTSTRSDHRRCLKSTGYAVILTALFGLGSTVAISAPQSETRSAKITLTDLDLSTPEGMYAARERLHETAHSLCSNFAHPADFSSCVNDAELPALRQLEVARAVQAWVRVVKN